MRGKELFEKFTHIKDEYIQEVEAVEAVEVDESYLPRRRFKYQTLAMLAAGIILLLCVQPLMENIMNGGIDEGMTEGAAGSESPENASSSSGAPEEGGQVDPSASGDSEGMESTDTSSGSSEPQKGLLPVFLDKYSNIDKLPVIEASIEQEYKTEDRAVIFETGIDNELEQLVSHVFCSSESDEYLCTTTIHDMQVLTKIEAEAFLDDNQLDLDNMVEEEALEETAVVWVDMTWEETHGLIGGGTYEHMPEGHYAKYFVLGRTEGSEEFQVHGVFLTSYTDMK